MVACVIDHPFDIAKTCSNANPMLKFAFVM